MNAYDNMDGRSIAARDLRLRAKIGETMLDCRASADAAFEHSESRLYEFDAEDRLVSMCKGGESLGVFDFDRLDQQ